MKKFLTCAALALALSGCTSGPRYGGMRGRDLPPAADPSRVIATELAFARAAREEGQWTAFREYAADDAVMFVPEAVNARDWLRRQTDPAASVQWQPYQVWSSCDGTLAVTKGAWQRPDGTYGYFTTIWERDDNDDDYKWVLDQGDQLEQPLEAAEMIGSKVADCASKVDQVSATAWVGEASSSGNGGSRDGTLEYEWAVFKDGKRRLRVSSWDGQEMSEVLATVAETGEQ